MKIKLDKEKLLEFEINTSGVPEEDLQGFLRFTFEGVEYGFPAKIDGSKISINIPAFQDVLNSQVKESISKNTEVIAKGRLDVIANGNAYVCPWSGDVEIEIPVSVKISEKTEKKSNKITLLSNPDKEELVKAFDGGGDRKDEDCGKDHDKEDKKKKKSKFMDAMK